MSLINEALKRARQAPVPPAPDLQFRPVEPATAARRNGGLLFPGLLGVFALLALLVVWHVVRPSHASTPKLALAPAVAPQAVATPEPPAVPSPAPTAPPVATPPTPAPSPASAPAPTETRPAAPATASAPAPESPAAVAPASNSIPPADVAAPAPPPAPPPLKLQGVVYNPRRPSAVISGKTLFIGDRIRDFRVVAISQESVTLTGAGQTNVLSLAD